MRVRGLVWVGTNTDRFDETVSFFRDRLGLDLADVHEDFALFRLPDTAQLEVFGPSEGRHSHFTTGPVPEFLVDDLAAAAAELRAADVEIWGPFSEDEDARFGWLHFRAPDGSIYGLTNGRQYRR